MDRKNESEAQVAMRTATPCTSITHILQTHNREETITFKKGEGGDDGTVKEWNTKTKEREETPERLDEDCNMRDWYIGATENVEEDSWFDHYLYDLTDKKVDETDEFSCDSDSAHNSESVAPNREEVGCSVELQEDSTGIQVPGGKSSETSETENT